MNFSGSKKKTINIKDLFIAPKFNELESIATNSKGKPKKLNHEQQESIHRTGEFSVDSVQFPGQKHRWRLSNILQKGSERSTETMYKNLSNVSHLFGNNQSKSDFYKKILFAVVVAREFLFGDNFGLKNAINGWSEGIVNILDILVGLPHLESLSIEDKVQEERMRFLVCELNAKEKERIKEIVINLRECNHSKEKHTFLNLPYIFFNTKNKSIDMRIYNNEAMEKIMPILIRIVKAESEGWFPEFRDKLISELKEQNAGNNEIEKQVNKKTKNEYLKRVCKAIQTDKIIQEAGEGIAELLINQLKAGMISQEALELVNEEIENQLKNKEVTLKKKNPICSKTKDWLERKLSEKEAELRFEKQFEPYEKAIDDCQTEGLDQHAYFLSRDLSFLKNQEPVLRKELQDNMKKPSEIFNFKTRIWNPKNWEINQRSDNQSKKIKTLIHSKPDDFGPFDNRDGPSFTLSKNTVRTNSTGNLFWRWTNFCHGVWSFIWNFMFWLGIVVPFCSSFSLRSLFCLDEFYPNYILSQRNGALYKDPESRTETLASKLKTLWKHIATKRKEFEAMPDLGLLGKSVARHLNKFVNYFLKGFFGSLLILLCFPISCLVVSSVCMTLALLAPILFPPLALVGILFSVIFCDYMSASIALVPSLFLNIVYCGIFLPLVSFFVAFVCCPVGALFIVLFSLTRKTLRQIWDSVLFHLVIKKRARIPASNTFIAKRIAGPGMASDYFYQVKTEQVLVALEAEMEIEELEAYRVQMADIISSPLVDYHKFVLNTMRPLSLAVTKDPKGPYQLVSNNTSGLLASLQEKVNDRINQLRLGLSHNMKQRIKLSERELKLALSRGAAMTSKFYPEHVIARTKGAEIEFWERRSLKLNDWVGLTSKLYSSIFDQEFLTPMQEEDITFQLKVDHWNLSRYVNMVIESDWHDDLDITRAVRSPKGNMEIPAPYFDPSLFNPSSTSFAHNLRPSKQPAGLNFRWAVIKQRRPNPPIRLSFPLPVPHPAKLVLIIHNRDSEDPIGLEHSQRIIQ